MLFGRRQPLLLLGQALMLERDNDLTGDPCNHFAIVLGEPVRLALGEREDATHHVSEDERRNDD